MAARIVRQACWPLGLTAACVIVAGTTVGFSQTAASDPPPSSSALGASCAEASPVGLCPLAAPPPGVLCQPERDPPKDEPGEPAEEKGEGEEPTVGLRKLTRQEINRIRYMELRGMRENKPSAQPDRVSCKVPRPVVDDFLAEMEGREDFVVAMTGSRNASWRKTQQAFRKLTAPQKLHTIAYFKGAKYADRVEITSEPEVFIEFRKNVLPVVMRGCATSSCHGSADREGARFVLHNDPKKTSATFYANFLMLQEIEVDGRRLIDRAQPENSLLLTYMLPVADVRPELRHPDTAKFKPIFHTRTALGYRRMSAWIRSLKHPSEDYGVRLFATTPTTVEDEEDNAKRAEESKPAAEHKDG